MLKTNFHFINFNLLANEESSNFFSYFFLIILAILFRVKRFHIFQEWIMKQDYSF